MTKRIQRGASQIVFVVLVIVIGRIAINHARDNDTADARWLFSGHDLNNSRSQPDERQVGASNVNRLVPKWAFTTTADVSATPTLADRSVYFPDWGGNLYAVNAETGTLLWTHSIADYNGRLGSISRVSPAIAGDVLLIGDNMATPTEHNGAHVFAVDRRTGALRWITQVDAHPSAVITAPPVVHNGIAYLGIASNEEALAANPAYVCCTFRGSIVALDVATGAVRWKTFTLPDNGGRSDAYSGNAVWGQAAIDPRRGTLYVGTGNNYSVPASAEECQRRANEAGDTRTVCPSADDHFDAMVALDLATGAIKWAHTLYGYDAWTVACLAAPVGVNCPDPAGPDYDFGSGPNLLEEIVGIGQKSGIYWALNPDSGRIVWSTIVGPGGTTGGIQWGTASDERRIYVAISNSAHTAYTLAGGGTTNGGSWAALDARSGKILWQIADPTPATIDPGAVSVANGVMYAGSYSGHMYALHARTGQILWSFQSGGSVIDGPSIVDGTIYWGSGYVHLPPGIPNNKVYAFRLAPR